MRKMRRKERKKATGREVTSKRNRDREEIEENRKREEYIGREYAKEKGMQ